MTETSRTARTRKKFFFQVNSGVKKKFLLFHDLPQFFRVLATMGVFEYQIIIKPGYNKQCKKT